MDDFSLERRRSARVAVTITVELRDERGFSLHSSSDVSLGGAFFDRAIPHAVGSKVTASFTLPGENRPIVCAAEVVNVPDEQQFGMGVRFIDLSAEDKRRLQAFTAKYSDEEKK
ncbi:MAG: PilZ domain-containing protein [Myxococcales bacterium]|nr:PilZ domain-containing protein [Myxococcales bacterium]